MNRITVATRRRTAPIVVASFDLADDAQKRTHELIRRLHVGRWPLFRALGMRQVNGEVHEAVEWLRMHEPTFGVVTYRRDGWGLSWSDYPSKTAALTALRST